MRRLKNANILAVIIIQALVLQAMAADRRISSELKKMAETFAGVSGGGKAAVAVFPFQADEKLSKRKVDFALGEMLTRQLIETGSFTVVERQELRKVLEEQKLGMTGLIRTESAAQVGQLLGARFLVTGSIALMGKVYQINSRLVDAGTGEVMSMGFAELDSDLFDEEARPYLTLVPDTQKIGLQTIAAYIPFTLDTGAPITVTGEIGNPAEKYTATVTPDMPEPATEALGLGVRYFPSSHIAVDATYFFPAAHKLKLFTRYDSDSFHQLELNLVTKIQRLALVYTRNLRKSLRTYLGAQVVIMHIDFREASDNSIELDYTDQAPANLDLDDDGIFKIIPSLRAGMEWNPQSRIGLSLFGNLALKSVQDVRTSTVSYNIKTNPGAPADMDDALIELGTLKIPVFWLELAFSFYF